MTWLAAVAVAIATTLFTAPGAAQTRTAVQGPASMATPDSPDTTAASTAAGAAIPTSPAYMTGSRLREACSGRESETGRLLCLGYLEGVWDSLSVLNPVLATSHTYAVNLCLPLEVKLEEIRDRVFAWMRLHANRDGETAASLVVLALVEGFSCAHGAPDPAPPGPSAP